MTTLTGPAATNLPGFPQTSEAPWRPEPFALELELGVFRDQVVVAVVVQDADPGALGARGDHDVARWQPVVTDPRQLFLCPQRESFDIAVDLNSRQDREIVQQPGVIVTGASGVAGLEQKREAYSDIPRFDHARKALADEPIVPPRPG